MTDDELAGAVVGALTERRDTIAVAESLTGGLLGAALTAVPGASAVVRGGVTAYATDVKATVLGVSRATLSGDGAVSASTATAMAAAVRRVLGADVGLALTGVAGPEPQEGKPAGTVFTAVVGPDAELLEVDRVEPLWIPGDRASIRGDAVRGALLLLARALGVVGDGPGQTVR